MPYDNINNEVSEVKFNRAVIDNIINYDSVDSNLRYPCGCGMADVIDPTPVMPKSTPYERLEGLEKIKKSRSWMFVKICPSDGATPPPDCACHEDIMLSIQV